VLASSGGVYRRGPEPLSEDAPLEPEGFYLRTKLATEVLAQAYAEEFAVCVLRPFFVYGPGQRGMLVPTLAERVLAGEEVTVEGRPGMRTNPTHVDDAARAFAAALSVDGGGVFNVGGPETLSLTDLVGLIGAEAGREPRLAHRDGDPGDLVADVTRMSEVLRAPPEVGPREGLAQVVAALRAGAPDVSRDIRG
jgi:nucleoside-diphosphate-sugar epimerase